MSRVKILTLIEFAVMCFFFLYSSFRSRATTILLFYCASEEWQEEPWPYTYNIYIYSDVSDVLIEPFFAFLSIVGRANFAAMRTRTVRIREYARNMEGETESMKKNHSAKVDGRVFARGPRAACRCGADSFASLFGQRRRALCTNFLAPVPPVSRTIVDRLCTLFGLCFCLCVCVCRDFFCKQFIRHGCVVQCSLLLDHIINEMLRRVCVAALRGPCTARTSYRCAAMWLRIISMLAS